MVRKNSCLKIGILVAAIVLASMFVGCVEEEAPEATPTPTATPKPIATPTLTSTPKTTLTATPMVTEQDVQYMEWALSANRILSSDIELMVSASNRGDTRTFGTYGERLYDDSVKLLNEIEQFNVSPTLRPSRDEFKLALEDYKMTGYYGEKAGQTYDDDYIYRAANYLESATRHLDRSTALLPY